MEANPTCHCGRVLKPFYGPRMICPMGHITPEGVPEGEGETRESEPINTHGMVLNFGKHKGELWTRVPKNYLRWLINERTQWSEIALAEMRRRGTTVSHNLEMSAHAIDRASLRCCGIWKSTRKNDEGLYSWLERMANEALESSEDRPSEVIYKDMKFAFEHGEYYPTLKTVHPAL